MLDKKISVSEQVANLPIEGQLLYTWMIPHADDFGLLPSSSRTVKALVIPMLDISAETVEKYLQEMIKNDLIRIFEHGGKKYYRIMNFSNDQTLKKDRQPQTILETELVEDHKENWDIISKLVENGTKSILEGTQKEDSGFQAIPEVNRTETKRTEEIEDTGDSYATGPEFKKPALKAIGSVLKDRYHVKLPDVKSGISYQWQDKAFRYADNLKITLSNEVKGRWLKIFKQAYQGRKAKNLEQAFSYLYDYPHSLTDEEKLKYFFFIYENGLQKNFNYKNGSS